MRKIALANQKGGVGKTTTAINLSATLAREDTSVLLVDMDPQSNATTGLGFGPEEFEGYLTQVLNGDLEPGRALVEVEQAGISLLPAALDLAALEVELASSIAREQKLSKALEQIEDEFDYCVIDCPPSLGLLTLNSLTAADGVIIPVQTEFYALSGLVKLIQTIDLVRDELNRELEILGILLTMFDRRTRLAHEVVEEVRSELDQPVFETIIPRNVRLAEAPGHGQPITAYDPNCKGAEAYRELAAEVQEIGVSA